MTEKQFVKHYAGRTKKRAIGIKDIETNRVYVTIEENIHLLNELADENKDLKEEVQLLKEGMEAYENSIPYVCTCEQVRDIHSEMFDFKMKQSKFYKEHPSRCTVIIDGVRYDDRE